jgi:hypothetical protein
MYGFILMGLVQIILGIVQSKLMELISVFILGLTTVLNGMRLKLLGELLEKFFPLQRLEHQDCIAMKTTMPSMVGSQSIQSIYVISHCNKESLY